MSTHGFKFFDPIHELGRRGVRVRLVEASGESRVMALRERRSLEQREEQALERWVEAVLARYDRLIRLQLQLAVGLVPYRTVQWLLAHGYIEIRDKQFRLVKR